jgi:hypothetical protein
MQLARRQNVTIIIQQVHDVVRVFLAQIGQRHAGKRVSLMLR